MPPGDKRDAEKKLNIRRWRHHSMKDNNNSMQTSKFYPDMVIVGSIDAGIPKHSL